MCGIRRSHGHRSQCLYTRLICISVIALFIRAKYRGRFALPPGSEQGGDQENALWDSTTEEMYTFREESVLIWARCRTRSFRSMDERSCLLFLLLLFFFRRRRGRLLRATIERVREVGRGGENGRKKDGEEAKKKQGGVPKLALISPCLTCEQPAVAEASLEELGPRSLLRTRRDRSPSTELPLNDEHETGRHLPLGRMESALHVYNAAFC